MTDNDKNVIMFSGKGGVGKTTCAAATALHFASQGERTLALSTDPTPSLRHIFEAEKQQGPAEISNELYLDEVGIERVKKMWDGKFGREVYEVFSSFVAIEYEDFVEFVSSILPGLRDEFMVDYIRELTSKNEYRKVIWDTAPMGQTLGLLMTPAMLGKHLKTAPRIYSKLKLGSESRKPVLDVIKGWEELSAIDMEFLRNSVDFRLVTIPEALAVEQLEDIFTEFRNHGLNISQLIINNVVQDTNSDFLRTKAGQQRQYIDALYDRSAQLEITELPMFPREIKGVQRIREIQTELFKSKE
ncbi:MAG: ArsA family ATPase [Dehalococcoidia bacterium]